LHHLSPLQSVCLQRSTAPRSKRKKHIRKKKNNKKHHQLEEQLTMSASRNLEKFSTPENWRVFVGRVRKQTGANAGNEPLLVENVNPNSSNKRKALVDIHPDTPLFSHCRAFSATLEQSNEDVCSFAR
jgi:hypothetical protein